MAAACYDALRYDLTQRIAMSRETIDERLAAILDRRKAACHIAIQGRIPDCHFAFVTCGQQHAAGLVRNRHQQQSTATRLYILFSYILIEAGEQVCQLRQSCLIHRLDWHDVVLHTQSGSLESRIFLAHCGGVAKRHHHCTHSIRTQRIASNCQDQRGIDATRQTNDNAGETVLFDVVACAGY